MIKRFKSLMSAIVLAALAAALALPAAALATEGETESESTASQPLYLALGDSITWGYEPNGKDAAGTQLTDECFVNILATDKGYTVENEAAIGNTATGILEQLSSGTLDDSIKQAKVITITCGGNDLMQVVYERTAQTYNTVNPDDKMQITADDVIAILANPQDERRNSIKIMAYWAIISKYKDSEGNNSYLEDCSEFKATLNTYIENLNTITAQIKKLNPTVRIFVATQYNPYGHFSGTYQLINTHVGACAKQLNDAIANNAPIGGYTVADVYAAFVGNTATYCNASETGPNIDFHPSVAGHAAIAKVFESVVPGVATVTAGEFSKTYGDPDPTFSATETGVKTGDTLTYTFSRKTGEDVGDYTLTPSGSEDQGSYLVYYASGKLTITAKSIVPDSTSTPDDEKTGISVSGIANVTYDGKDHKLEPVISDAQTGATLKAGTDYTLAYSGDTTELGTVTITVTGTGNYTGSFELSYQIVEDASGDGDDGPSGDDDDDSGSDASGDDDTDGNADDSGSGDDNDDADADGSGSSNANDSDSSTASNATSGGLARTADNNGITAALLLSLLVASGACLMRVRQNGMARAHQVRGAHARQRSRG